jgi:hypothetical protein
MLLFKDLSRALSFTTFRFDYPLCMTDNFTFRYAAFDVGLFSPRPLAGPRTDVTCASMAVM